jgi:hypothetical protein
MHYNNGREVLNNTVMRESTLEVDKDNLSSYQWDHDGTLGAAIGNGCWLKISR